MAPVPLLARLRYPDEGAHGEPTLLRPPNRYVHVALILLAVGLLAGPLILSFFLAVVGMSSRQPSDGR